MPADDLQGVLEASDLRTIVLESADQLAPGDLETLMANEARVRRRATKIAASSLPLFRAQLDLAIDCLRDHFEGRCPQIPYRTISIITAAVLYFTDDHDIIPDFLPHMGRLDDAAIMAMAFKLAQPGLERYCAFTGRELPHDRPLPAATPAPRRTKAKR
jgi:uncharacterized membrane protein YkvA (DUF1232 family)